MAILILGKAFEKGVKDIKNFKMKDEKSSVENHEEPLEDAIENEESANKEDANPTEELSEIEKKDIEIQELKDKHLRLYSEFDNFRRRTQKEKLELYKTAGEDIFKALLPVMDDFERAKKSMEESHDYDSLKVGVDLIYSKFLHLFNSNDVEPMTDVIGSTFDSEIHEAITQVPASSEDLKGKVVDLVEQGYTLKDKVIRFAKVVVGQ
ncbi:nucleotide exchange factor GrpE [Vicingaceae bacterium]|nr:nucleotide exchange factor GrpE [Vicingaceae bacterium]